MKTNISTRVKATQSLVTVTEYLLLCVSNRLCPQMLTQNIRIDLREIMEGKGLTAGKIADEDIPPFTIRCNYPKELKAYGEDTTP